MFQVTQPDGSTGTALLEATDFFKLKKSEVYFNAVFVGEDFTAADAAKLFDEVAEIPTFDLSVKRQAELIEKVAEALGGAVSITEQKPTSTTPEWAPGAFVKKGEALGYKGAYYVCVQAHVTQADWAPPTVPALWRAVVVATEPEVYPAWVQPLGAHDAYAVGAIVTHKGKTWKNTIAANVWEPGVAGWVEYTDLKGAKK